MEMNKNWKFNFATLLISGSREAAVPLFVTRRIRIKGRKAFANARKDRLVELKKDNEKSLLASTNNKNISLLDVIAPDSIRCSIQSKYEPRSTIKAPIFFSLSFFAKFAYKWRLRSFAVLYCSRVPYCNGKGCFSLTTRRIKECRFILTRRETQKDWERERQKERETGN